MKFIRMIRFKCDRILLSGLFLVMLLAACSKSDPKEQAPAVDGVFEKRGANAFVFKKYAPLASKPIQVYYYIPGKGDVTKMPVLFSLDGTDRNAAYQRDSWMYFAEENGFIVIAPNYTKTYYDDNEYQYGGVFTSSTYATLRNSEQWTFQSIEAIFDYFKSETGSTASSYNMFGHSAGGQFVHRFVLSMPNARVNKAVAANSGIYTLPVLNGLKGTDGKIYGWPFAVKNTPFANNEQLKDFFARKLYVQLGQLDTDEDNVYMTDNPAANAQGLHRLERGRYFYTECQRVAAELKAPLNIQKAEVANAAHSTLRMIYGRAVPDPANTSSPGPNSAFNLIFK